MTHAQYDLDDQGGGNGGAGHCRLPGQRQMNGGSNFLAAHNEFLHGGGQRLFVDKACGLILSPVTEVLSAPKSQRFLRFAIAMPIADPRNRSDFQDKRKQYCIAI